MLFSGLCVTIETYKNQVELKKEKLKSFYNDLKNLKTAGLKVDKQDKFLIFSSKMFQSVIKLQLDLRSPLQVLNFIGRKSFLSPAYTRESYRNKFPKHGF